MFSALELPAFLRGDQRLMKVLSFSTLVYILTSPCHNPDSRTRELQLPLVLFQTHHTQTKGQATFGLWGAWARGESVKEACAAFCPVRGNMGEQRFLTPHSVSVEVNHFLAQSTAQSCTDPSSLLNKQVTWSTLFGPLTYCFCFHTCML